jgi:beta-hydroxylase
MLKWLVLLLFLAAVAYVHLRGKVRHRWFKQLFDHSALLAPINVLMYWMSGVPRGPYVPKPAFPDLVALEKHWPEMLAEAQALAEREQIKAANNDDAGFNSFFKEGWKRFYLKWYDEPPPSAAACPRTVALLREAPSIKAALFAYLPAGAKLNPHRDPYAGSLRYHLGLATPNDDRCRIWVDGEPYSWRDGEGVIFDETYIHWVRNDTEQGVLAPRDERRRLAEPARRPGRCDQPTVPNLVRRRPIPPPAQTVEPRRLPYDAFAIAGAGDRRVRLVVMA